MLPVSSSNVRCLALERAALMSSDLRQLPEPVFAFPLADRIKHSESRGV